MTATAPSDPAHDAVDEARTGTRPKEPDNLQTTPQDQPFPQADSTLSTGPDVHPKTENETGTKRASNHPDQEYLKYLGVSGKVSDALPPKHDANAWKGPQMGGSTGPRCDVTPNSKQPVPGIQVPAHQSHMQIDTPTPLGQQLPDRSTTRTGIQPPFPQSIQSGPVNVDLDLLPYIPGLFRLLDLYSERGSNDHFDKVIIDHESMGDAMNTLRDGSYKNISKIDFSQLDSIPIKPMGIYGSKSAIVRFFLDIGVIEEPVAESLMRPVNRNGQLVPYLRSGIYLHVNISPSHLQSPSPTVVHVIYWPEDDTWNDKASPSIEKNRIAFMRYLTKLASDVRLLVSEEHAASFIWKYDNKEDACDKGDESSSDEDSDGDDRFVKFEVTKTVDEEEGAKLFPGPTFHHQALGASDHSNIAVRLIPSETSQAFMVTKIREAGFQAERIATEVTALRLRSLMGHYQNICLGENIGEASIDCLFHQGALPPSAKERYLEYLNLDMGAPEVEDQRSGATSELESDWPNLRKRVEHHVRQRFATEYPSLDLDSGDDFECSLESYLTPVFAKVPKAKSIYDQYQSQGVPKLVDSTDYQTLKERFLDVQSILEESESITDEKRRLLLEGIHSPDGHNA
ncbi:hypothetical protein FRC01_009904, partial [Tulasnella sp. 417]